MKTIKHLNLASNQLLTLDEQEKVVAGLRREFLGSSGYCGCSAVGQSHTIVNVYECTPEITDFMGGGIVQSLYLGSIIGGGINSPCGCTPPFMVDPILLPLYYNLPSHYESDILVFTCTGHDGKRATSHSSPSISTVMEIVSISN